MTDYYKTLADADPGGDLQAAYEAMKAETVDVSRGEYRITDQDIAAEIGPVEGLAFTAALEAARDAGALKPRILRWLEGKGIDINNPGTRGMLAQLVAADHLDQALVDKVVAMGSIAQPKYPGLELGHLQNARDWRKEGKI